MHHVCCQSSVVIKVDQVPVEKAVAVLFTYMYTSILKCCNAVNSKRVTSVKYDDCVKYFKPRQLNDAAIDVIFHLIS